MSRLTWEEWRLELGKVAEAENYGPADDHEESMARTWRPHFEAGLTPPQAWDAVPWTRDR